MLLGGATLAQIQQQQISARLESESVNPQLLGEADEHH